MLCTCYLWSATCSLLPRVSVLYNALQVCLYHWQQLIGVQWLGLEMERLVCYSLVLLTLGFYWSTCLWWLSVCWALEKLSILVHIIWARRLKDRKAAVENEIRVAGLYMEWVKKVSLITSWPFCLSILVTRVDEMQAADHWLITKSGMWPSGWNSWLPC
jgi:hypothetical protein